MFGGMPVEFVPEGQTAEEARRGRKRKGVTAGQALQALGALLALALIVALPAWWFFGRPDESQAQGLEPTQAATETTRAGELLTYETSTGVPQPTPTHTPTATATAEPTVTPTAPITVTNPTPLEPIFSSPVVIVVTATPTPTPSPSPTPSPTKTPAKAYEVIYQASDPETLYSYVSGWVVERDGVTPRPVAMTLRHATGSMSWPRPGNRDVATGYYEFMVSPGEYWLDIAGSDLGPVYIVVGDTPARYETSFRYTRADRLAVAAVSQPWAGDDQPLLMTTVPLSPVATPTPTPTAKTRLYLPLICR